MYVMYKLRHNITIMVKVYIYEILPYVGYNSDNVFETPTTSAANNTPYSKLGYNTSALTVLNKS